MKRIATIAAFVTTLLTAVTLVAQQGPPRGEPPQAAIDVCDGATESDACAFEHKDRTIEGVCRVPPQQERLICVPEGHHRGGDKKRKR